MQEELRKAAKTGPQAVQVVAEVPSAVETAALEAPTEEELKIEDAVPVDQSEGEMVHETQEEGADTVNKAPETPEDAETGEEKEAQRSPARAAVPPLSLTTAGNEAVAKAAAVAGKQGWKQATADTYSGQPALLFTVPGPGALAVAAV